MDKWTVLIIGTLVFLGVVHYLESIEIEDGGWEDFYVSSNGEIYECTDEGLQRALCDLNETGGSVYEINHPNIKSSKVK